MKIILILHLVGMVMVYAVMWRSVWRKKAQGEGRLWGYIIGGIFIGLLWEPFYIIVILRNLK